MTSINIPGSVTSIGQEVFSGCSSLTSVTIPGTIRLKKIPIFPNLNSLIILGNVDFIANQIIENYRSIASVTIKNATSIVASAFSGCSGLTSISISEGVTSIGQEAFSGCSGLTSISIPEGVTSIGASVFSGCSDLTSISIPEGVTSIGASAFSGCSALTSLSIPEGVTSIGASVFSDCSALTSLSIPEGVTSIGASVFSGCSGLTSLVIPNSVISLGENAFLGCRDLTFLSIPDRFIDSDIQQCSKLASLTVYGNVSSICSQLIKNNPSLTSVTIKDATSIGEYFFSGCSGLTSISIPEGVTSIGSSAFSGCSGLTSISIPEGVTSIGSSAFSGCSGLTSISIPKSVTSIGNNAFENCSGLSETIVIPANVTEIANQTFYGCSNLPLVRLTNNVTSIGNQAFDGCKALKSFAFTPNITSIGNSAFRNCSGLTSIKLPSKVAQLGDYAFADCENLESAIFNSNVEINLTTFENDTKLKTLTSDACYFDGVAFYNKEKTKLIGVFDYTLSECIGIPETVTTIGEHAFKDCTNLSKINLPSGLISVGDDAFCNCEKLASVSFSDQLESIGARAFLNCTNLSQINMSSGLTSMGDDVFNNCKKLESISLSDQLDSIGARAFLNCTNLSQIKLPSGLIYVGEEAFCNCEKMKLKAFPDKLKYIGWSAFYNCSNITIKRWPSTLEYIGGVAFGNCMGITTFTLVNHAQLGASAFTNCTGLKTVNISPLTYVNSGLFEDCTALNRVVTSEKLTEVGHRAFKNCSNLEFITLSSVRSICSEAFYGCSKLKNVYMAYVSSLGSRAFYGCNKLEEINMPNVKSLDYSAFKGCSALKNANILSCVSISDSVFKDCAALQSIQIQTDSLCAIGKEAFGGCSSLTSPWEFLNSDMTIADSAFIGCTSLKKIRVRRNNPYSYDFAENMVVYVPEGSKEAYQVALPQCTIYEDYSKNRQKCQDLLSLYDSYNQIDFKPLVDEEADAPWTESNVLTDVSQLSANFVDEYEGSLDALVDSSDDSYFMSAWDVDNPNEDYHYIQADLKKGCKAFKITFKRRSTNDNSAPTRVHVFVTNTLDDDNSWIDLGRDTLIYNGLTASINANYYAKVRYVRLQVEATVDNTKENGNLFFALNKLDITPCRLNTSIPKWDDGLYYAIKRFSGATFNNYDLKEFLEGTSPLAVGLNEVFFGLQYATPIKYFVIKYLKSDDLPIQTMQLNSFHEDGSSENLAFDADYSYFGNSTGIYCAKFEKPSKDISLQNIDDHNSYNHLRTAHVYTRPPKENLMSEDAITAIKDMLSLYGDKDFIRENDFETLQNYCNEITRLAQTGRFADFAKHEYCTFYADYPAVVPMLVKAGIVKEQNGELVVDYIYNEGDVIPANTGVILKGNCLGNAYVMEQGTTDATSPEGNLLHGTVDDEETYVDGCSRYYMLSYDKAGDSRLGFYWNGENGPQPFINKAYKAYLAIPDTYSAMAKESFGLADMEEHRGEITHISSVSNDKSHMQSGIYNIDGRKIDATNIKQLPAGVYIVNGKKVIVK